MVGLDGLLNLLISKIEWKLGEKFKEARNFKRDGIIAREATEHSKAMMWNSYCDHAPKDYWGSALAELVGRTAASYNDWAIEQAIEGMACDFLVSPRHGPSLEALPVIGGGIAVRIIGDEIHLYVTLRLKY